MSSVTDNSYFNLKIKSSVPVLSLTISSLSEVILDRFFTKSETNWHFYPCWEEDVDLARVSEYQV